MRIGIIAPPFIEVPPRRYGGTELFVGNLARELHARGHDLTVYANGDSCLPCRVKARYAHAEWPLDDAVTPHLKNADHTSWAMYEAACTADVIHLNDVVGVPFTRFIDAPTVLTIHHPHEPALSEQYARYPNVHYVTIADWLSERESMPRMSVIHHGIPVDDYTWSDEKDDYVAFLGRMAPCKGPHLAIEAARLAGVRLKLAGEVQPLFRDYWEGQVRAQIDGDQFEYIGEADWMIKNELLSRARALLVPIQWEEPFGLVMIEAMACGTPVLAFAGGAVEEIVSDGENGWICRDVADMAARIRSLTIGSAACRNLADRRFSIKRMADDYERVYEDALGRARPPLAASLEA
ncbi:MAG TPA: glycosyltransferase family 4 protein [Vicinamibacterales bacterium]|jgi:glycosyltransferase involved in cell wall biosynthesis